MATRDQFKLSLQDRRLRKFSDSFKRGKVREIEQGKTRIGEICREYEVSDVSVYNWIAKFGNMKKNKQERLIVETESDTRHLLELKKRIADLERMIGQKQILLDFKDKMIELAEEEYGVDIKKKFSTELLNTSGTSGLGTASV
jgi:transposase